MTIEDLPVYGEWDEPEELFFHISKGDKYMRIMNKDRTMDYFYIHDPKDDRMQMNFHAGSDSSAPIQYSIQVLNTAPLYQLTDHQTGETVQFGKQATWSSFKWPMTVPNGTTYSWKEGGRKGAYMINYPEKKKIARANYFDDGSGHVGIYAKFTVEKEASGIFKWAWLGAFGVMWNNAKFRGMVPAY